MLASKAHLHQGGRQADAAPPQQTDIGKKQLHVLLYMPNLQEGLND